MFIRAHREKKHQLPVVAYSFQESEFLEDLLLRLDLAGLDRLVATNLIRETSIFKRAIFLFFFTLALITVRRNWEDQL